MLSHEKSNHPGQSGQETKISADGGETTGAGSKSAAKRAWVAIDKLTGRATGTSSGETRSEGKATRKIQPLSERFPAQEVREVVLTCQAPTATVVQVAGTFNAWHPEANPLEHAAGETWVARLKLKSGRYEYRFVVDGAWTDDPDAPRKTPNPFGGQNAVLNVGLDDRAEFL